LIVRRPIPRYAKRVQAKAKSRAPLLFAVLLAIPIAFWLGRWSESMESRAGSLSSELAAAPECPEPPPSAVSAVPTSTIGLCPCPRPKPPVSLAIKRKNKPPVETPPHEPPDPTAATARYIKEHAQDLAQCAPKSGGELRVHIEVTVMPRGAIERVRITNLDPLPPGVTQCVHRTILALKPPGFDAMRSEIFAITVVL
jgi:hypothetical protein